MKKLVVEEFDSLTQYIDVIGSRKTNSLFTGRSLSSEKNDINFTMTETYSDSVNLAKNGYKEGLGSLMSASVQLQHRENIKKNMPSVDFVGYAPHVANAIAGIPKSMISVTKTEQKAKVITILYSHGDSAFVDAESFIKAGKNVLNVMYTLETQGYRIGLYIMDAMCKSQKAISIVQVKNWRQPSNPLKMAYPLLHPAYFRRQGFKWLETNPEIKDEAFLGTYGQPLRCYCDTVSNQKKFLRENGILKQGWFYTTFNEAYANNADQLIKLMGIK